MTQFIYDEEELHRFFDRVVPPLKPGETYFLSLSARDKYLSKEEREEFSLGRSEMFERRVIRERDWTSFLRTIRKYETVEGAYTGRTGRPIPTKAMVVYWNTNPTNAMKAYVEFSKLMTENIGQMLTGSGSSAEFFTRTNRYLMNEFQRQRGTRHYVDYDLDILDMESAVMARAGLLLNLIIKGVKFFVIETRGGWHILMRKDTIRFNYNELFAEMVRLFPGAFSEVKLNENEMIPLPGTMQAGSPVRVLWDISRYDDGEQS